MHDEFTSHDKKSDDIIADVQKLNKDMNKKIDDNHASLDEK